MNIHEKLTSLLTCNEDVFIYDEPNNVAVTVVNSNSLIPLYIARAFLPSVSAWVVVDMQNTDQSGGQFMYQCLLKASYRFKKYNNVSQGETEKRKL